jgi:hypothetical protein
MGLEPATFRLVAELNLRLKHIQLTEQSNKASHARSEWELKELNNNEIYFISYLFQRDLWILRQNNPNNTIT